MKECVRSCCLWCWSQYWLCVNLMRICQICVASQDVGAYTTRSYTIGSMPWKPQHLSVSSLQAPAYADWNTFFCTRLPAPEVLDSLTWKCSSKSKHLWHWGLQKTVNSVAFWGYAWHRNSAVVVSRECIQANYWLASCRCSKVQTSSCHIIWSSTDPLLLLGVHG